MSVSKRTLKTRRGTRIIYGSRTQIKAVATTPSNWPQYSEAFGCLPSQVEEFTKDCAENGIPTEYTRDGRAIFRDRDHRRQFYQWQGKHDKNGMYRDA